MVEVHRLTDNNKETLTKLMVSNRQLKDKNIVLQADLEELQDSLSDSRKL